MTDNTTISYGGGSFIHRVPRLDVSPLEEIYTRQATWVIVEGVKYKLAAKGHVDTWAPLTWAATATIFGANYIP